MNLIKKFLAVTGMALVVAVPFGGVVVAVDPFEEVCQRGGSSKSTVCSNEVKQNTNTNPLTGNKGIITSITNIVALVAGTAAVIIIIVAGLQYVVANGDSAKITNARNTIIYAVIGLIIIIMARGIIVFVLSRI